MTTFLHLPLELRQKVYRLALPAQRLKAQSIPDPAWAFATKPVGIPALFFVTRSISEEAAAIFYSRAALSITPLRPPSLLFDSRTEDGPKLNLAFGLDVQFAAVPRRHLERINTALVFSGQPDAVNAEGYEALLRWLVDNTAVREIYLSPRLMTRLRKTRADVNAISNLCEAASDFSLQRTIRVYVHQLRPQWELTRMQEINRALRGAKLPDVQAYVLEKAGQHDALLDPRWDLRKSSEVEEVEALHSISTWLDGLMAADDVANQPECDSDRKYMLPGLYQICFVLGRSRHTIDQRPPSN